MRMVARDTGLDLILARVRLVRVAVHVELLLGHLRELLEVSKKDSSVSSMTVFMSSSPLFAASHISMRSSVSRDLVVVRLVQAGLCTHSAWRSHTSVASLTESTSSCTPPRTSPARTPWRRAHRGVRQGRWPQRVVPRLLRRDVRLIFWHCVRIAWMSSHIVLPSARSSRSPSRSPPRNSRGGASSTTCRKTDSSPHPRTAASP